MKQIQKSFELQAPLVRGKKRYLCGIATGLKQDVHGERMSGNCIRSIIRQAREQDVLLFPDEHGIRESEDIGILHNVKQLPNGDVYVEFRLYDATDAVQSIDVANKLWAQANGLPPYTKPRAKGFSIEDEVDLEDEVVKKAVKKSETGRAPADEKINTLDPGDERALQVLKSLFTRVQKAEQVPKETIKYFHETHRVMKSLFGKVEQQQQRIHDLERSVAGMQEGMGVTDKTLASPKRRVAKSRLSPDAQALIEAFGNAIQKSHYPQGHECNTRFDMGVGESLGDGRRSLIRKALDSSIGAGEGPFSPLIAQKLEKVITNVVTRLSPEFAVIKTEYAPQKFHEFNRLTALPKPNGFMGEGAATPTHQSFYTRDKVDLKVLRRKGAVTNFLQDVSKGYIDAAAAEMENHLQSHAYDIITALLWGHAKANKYSTDGLDALIETNRENKALGGEVPQSLAFLDDMIDQNIEKQGAAHTKCFLMSPKMQSYVSRLLTNVRLNQGNAGTATVEIAGGWRLETYRNIPIRRCLPSGATNGRWEWSTRSAARPITSAFRSSPTTGRARRRTCCKAALRMKLR